MAAGLVALRDHGIRAMRFKPSRLFDRRRRGQDKRAGRLHAIQQGGVRQAEVKRDDSRLHVFDDGTEGGIEGRAAGACGN